jgi:general secretion pathway protein I
MRARGFTLVEVMVALAIVAVALPALLLALSQQADDTAYLRDKTVAQMVAANKLAEIRLVVGSTRNLQAGRSNGVETMVGRDWHWWVETVATPVEKFFRIEIRVALDPQRQDQPLYTLTAFMTSDLAIDTEGLPEAPDEPDQSGNPPDRKLPDTDNPPPDKGSR